MRNLKKNQQDKSYKKKCDLSLRLMVRELTTSFVIIIKETAGCQGKLFLVK